MGAEDDSIVQAVASRRERLQALKAAQELLNTPDGDTNQVENKDADENVIDDQINDEKEVDGDTNVESEANKEKNFNMKFRNYVPHAQELQEGKLAPPVLPKFEDPIAETAPPSEKEDPLVNIAPKKPNWDLRRDVQKKLDKLEKRTQKALYKILQEQETQNRVVDNDGSNGGIGDRSNF